MSKEFTVRGVEVSSVNPNNAWVKSLETVDFVPARLNPKYVPVSESFEYVDDRTARMKGEERVVLAWTEGTLRRMDRLGIAFPVSVSLYGPVMLPSAEDLSVLVPVWYSTGFNWNGGWNVHAAVVRIVDELMDGTLADELLSYEDRWFLAYHYPYYLDVAAWKNVVSKRLWEGVREPTLEALYA